MRFMEMLENYGVQFLQETSPYLAVYPMEDFNTVLENILGDFDSYTVACMVAYGHRYGRDGVFNPDSKYFMFTMQGNLESVDADLVEDYLVETIYWKDFEKWLIHKGVDPEFRGFYSN